MKFSNKLNTFLIFSKNVKNHLKKMRLEYIRNMDKITQAIKSNQAFPQQSSWNTRHGVRYTTSKRKAVKPTTFGGQVVLSNFFLKFKKRNNPFNRVLMCFCYFFHYFIFISEGQKEHFFWVFGDKIICSNSLHDKCYGKLHFLKKDIIQTYSDNQHIMQKQIIKIPLL